MPFIYGVGEAGTDYATSASADTELVWAALRQATRSFRVTAMFFAGKAVAATTLNGISHHLRRWTTAGTGGTAVTPSPRDANAPAAVTTAGFGAPTPGTVSGAVQLSVGHSASGPGGWVARDDNSKIHVDAGTSDELAAYSIQGGTSALDFTGSFEIEE